MNDIRKEFLDILADIRAHLEYQRALGVRLIAVPTAQDRTAPMASSSAPVEMPSPAAADIPVCDSLEEIQKEIGDCRRCKLFKGRKTIVFGEGDPKAAVLFVGEGPGFEEDQQGRPFVGPAGQLLTDIIEKGMKLKRMDVYICNIVKCRPPGNRNPEPDEVKACIAFVKQQIAVIRPKVIVTLGNVPTQNLLGSKAGITKLRGEWQEYQGIPVMPTFHPSYLLRSPGEKGKAWDDIKKVMGKLGMAIPEKK
jgi:uracil-DNA glycosylase family 4